MLPCYAAANRKKSQPRLHNTKIRLWGGTYAPLVNRLPNPAPSLPNGMPAWQRFVAHTSHVVLYVLMFALPLVGRTKEMGSRVVAQPSCERGGGFAEAAGARRLNSGGDVEQGYSPSFEKLLALSLIAFIAILGPFHPMISSFLSSSSSVAMKNFSSSC